MPTLKETIVIKRDNTEYHWGLSVMVSHYIPAQTSGEPENCYPEQGGEIEEVNLELESVTGFNEPLYYHACHSPHPDDSLIEKTIDKLFESQSSDYDDSDYWFYYDTLDLC